MSIVMYIMDMTYVMLKIVGHLWLLCIFIWLCCNCETKQWQEPIESLRVIQSNFRKEKPIGIKNTSKSWAWRYVTHNQWLESALGKSSIEFVNLKPLFMLIVYFVDHLEWKLGNNAIVHSLNVQRILLDISIT